MPEAQIIVVEYNSRKNAYEGKRNVWRLVDIEKKKDIASTIESQLKTLKDGGYVLVNFAQTLFICEKDNVDHTQPYKKHKVVYHPYAKEFTV